MAGFGDREAGLAFFLLLDYPALGFAVSSPATSVNELRVHGQPPEASSTSSSAPAPDRFPALVALGEHIWVDNRDERFWRRPAGPGRWAGTRKERPTDRRPETANRHAEDVNPHRQPMETHKGGTR